MIKKLDWNVLIAYSFLFLAIIGIVDRIWVAEDAYITFRHIDNFFAGNGLTFNRGEKVEGFTHPLWAFLLIALRFIGIPNHQGAILLGIFFSLGGLILAYLFFQKKTYGSIFILPALLISNPGFRDFSTSGLEFPLTFLLLISFHILVLGKEIRNEVFAISILSLLYLTRPEFGILLFYYGFVLFYSYIKDRDYKRILWITLPVILIAGGYHLFRLFYYHDIFPNTYYAKSGGDSNYLQGFRYIAHTLRYSPLLIPFVLAFFILTPSVIKKDKSQLKFLARDFFGMFLLIFYIIRVGGDFMAFRLFLPSIAIFSVLSQFYLSQWWVSKNFPEKYSQVFNGFLFMLCIYFIFGAKKIPLVKNAIVDERQVYTRELNQGWISRFNEIKYPWYVEGLKVKELSDCLKYKNFIITNSITNAKCSTGLGLGYYAVAAGTDVILIDELGLTDRYIARQKRPDNFRPGHERSVGLDYLIDRGALFCSLNNPEYDENMKTRFGVIINLSPEFLFRLGKVEYIKKTGKLKEIFLKTRYPRTDQEKEIHNWLMKLEQRYKMKIMELPDSIPAEYETYTKCW